MALELKATDHSYYCSENNYYVDEHENWGRYEYDSWGDFKSKWPFINGSINDDLNHVFRFDITEDEDYPGTFDLWLFFILQRKGIFRPVWIKNITSDDIPEIESFLKSRWEYMKNQWAEVAE